MGVALQRLAKRSTFRIHTDDETRSDNYPAWVSFTSGSLVDRMKREFNVAETNVSEPGCFP
jgi:hypothetical protein